MEAVRTIVFFLVLRHSVSSLELTGPPVHAARLGSDTRVPCPFTVDNPPVDPNHLTIFWYFRDKEILSYNKTVRTTSPKYSLSTELLGMGIANLTIINIQIPDGGMYKCSTVYGSEKKEKEVRLDIGAPPQVTVTDKMAAVNAESVLRCSVTGFYPVDIDIKWLKDGEKLNNIYTEDPQRNSDRTYSVKSSVTITPTEEDRERIFSCRVYHDFLQVPLQKDFRLMYEAPPQVTVTDKKVVLNAKSVLRCSATGFFPPDIDIKWIRDGEKLEDSNFLGDPWRNPNGTYSVISTVTITPTEEDEERTFSCRVHHKSLRVPFQEDFRLVYEDRSSAGIIVGCFIPVVMLIIIITGVLWWRLKRRRKAPLTVGDIVGPPKLIDGEETALHCTVDNAPEDLCVTWLIRRAGQEQEIQTPQMREHSEEEKESLLDTSYVIKSQVVGRQHSSSLSFIPHMESHKDVTFICRGVSGKRKGERTFSCETIYVKPKMSQKVSRSLSDFKEMKYLLKLEKFYPKSIKIIWTCGEKGKVKVVSSTDSISENPDRSYNVSSEINIPEDQHKDPGFRVRLTWEHDSMEKPESSELYIRDSDYRWTPVVEEIQIPRLLLGSPAVLQCNISEYFPDAVTVKWMRRDGDQIHEETDDNQRITSRRAADNTYSCIASLTITPDLRTHQGAEYVCLVEHPSLERPIERSTEPLQVYVKPKMSQKVSRSLSDCGEMKYLLKLEKFYPKSIKITWTCGEKGKVEVVSSTDSISENPDRSYNVSSEINIPEDQHKDPGFRVRVTWEHDSMEKPESSELNIRDSDYRWTPVVEEIQIPRLLLGSSAVLQCNISEYFPDAVTVKWMRRDGDQIHEEIDNNQRITSRRAADNTYSCTASLTFTPDLRTHQGAEYVCLVEHPSLERPIERSTEPLQVYGKPQMSAPIAITMADSSRVQFSLNLQKFYPEDIKISCRWENTNDNYGKRPDVETKSTQNDDLTYDVTSVVKISNYSFRNPEKKFIVEWEHESMETSEWRSLSVRDFHWRPHVGSISVPRLEDGEEATLTCDISGYFPDLLTVIWFTKKDGDVTELPRTSSSYMDRTYKMSQKETKQADNTYSCEASLTFTPKIISHQGSEILCRVEHPSEERPIERSTRPLHIDYPWTLIVEEIQIPRLLLGSPAVLQCNMSGYFPDAVTVKWMRRDGDQSHEETDDNQRITSRRATDNTYSRTASLTITPDLRTHQGAEYICLVEHPSLETPIERRTGRLQVYGKPQMSAPIEITTADKSRVQFSLNLQKFYPKDIKISWYREDQSGKYGLSAVETISAQDEDLTYVVTSAVQIPGYQFKDPEMKIIVEWEHESMETSETKSLGVRDLPWRPHVGSINVSELEDGKSATLTCDISGYFPDLLSVIWFTKKDGNVTELPRQSSLYINRTYKISEKEKRKKDNTYSREASLTFTPKISSHQGSEILCRVEHPSEERPIERSTGPLHIGEK
ncbi:uncharacterized protein [Dendrobates tinctorius]|uniref:uncharacterized protein n=1 Tax=Dendrobates tinctorius TaxID=92724 RepID=UPI003CC94D60